MSGTDLFKDGPPDSRERASGFAGHFGAGYGESADAAGGNVGAGKRRR